MQGRVEFDKQHEGSKQVWLCPWPGACSSLHRVHQGTIGVLGDLCQS